VPVIEPAIPKSIRFAEAPSQGRSILSTAASGPGAQSYRQIADRLISGELTHVR
jgi:chromosome partitioning protein